MPDSEPVLKKRSSPLCLKETIIIPPRLYRQRIQNFYLIAKRRYTKKETPK
ncbi:predicted protein [Neisseria gonorrhoeae PID1]|nr:predicted protein [Neisseria gonorrhoeae 35/02]EEZ52582.1 predicted protein [Neisseria gonorrhoeae PID1]EEZ57079.1 predicted protein [Neisseria gonorrhoeae SK-92-679]EEZ59396.1 predicted protein [Neisseria gonorrhoeae SK-93-1035]